MCARGAQPRLEMTIYHREAQMTTTTRPTIVSRIRSALRDLGRAEAQFDREITAAHLGRVRGRARDDRFIG